MSSQKANDFAYKCLLALEKLREEHQDLDPLMVLHFAVQTTEGSPRESMTVATCHDANEALRLAQHGLAEMRGADVTNMAVLPDRVIPLKSPQGKPS